MFCCEIEFTNEVKVTWQRLPTRPRRPVNDIFYFCSISNVKVMSPRYPLVLAYVKVTESQSTVKINEKLCAAKTDLKKLNKIK